MQEGKRVSISFNLWLCFSSLKVSTCTCSCAKVKKKKTKQNKTKTKSPQKRQHYQKINFGHTHKTSFIPSFLSTTVFALIFLKGFVVCDKKVPEIFRLENYNRRPWRWVWCWIRERFTCMIYKYQCIIQNLASFCRRCGQLVERWDDDL